MSEGMNKVILMGNLGADPEFRFTGGGTGVLNIRLATTEVQFNRETKERKDHVEWHNVVVWGTRAEGLTKILRKGDALLIEGRLRTTSYEKDGTKRYKTEVHADEVRLCGGKGGGAEAGGERTSRGASGGPSGGAARGNGFGRPVAGKPPHINDMGGPPGDDIPW